MRFRDRVEVVKGECLLSLVWVLGGVCRLPVLCDFYRALIIKLVRKTRLFDDVFYLESNPDIAESGMSCVHHYVVFGDSEGRFPMALFDPSCYRESLGGWARNVNSLLHYSYVGRYRRISPSPWFDVAYYTANNKDVTRSGLDPMVHFLAWGGFEGRSPCAEFDSAYYLENNPDVFEARVNPLLHYLYYGRREGRKTLPEVYDHVCDKGCKHEVQMPILPGKDEWDSLQSHSCNYFSDIDVVIPVYKGMAETLRCIYSVLSAKCDAKYDLIVINDASPEEPLVKELERLSGKGLFKLLENTQNRGFVQTVNKGMSLHESRDVVLLNSDTEVYDGWLDRMQNAAVRDGLVGTVTPLSNNATICSYPHFLHENPFPLEIPYNELDAVIAKENQGEGVEAPTGVGFCMYIKRDCIRDVGLFDEKTFGKGYGEENDFCQRAIKKGWKNFIAADVFVRHWGSVSFKGEKAKLADNALRLVEYKHPDYQKDVSEFIKRKPLSDIYRRMDWARLLRVKQEKNILLISHGRGGGTERHIKEDVERLVTEGWGVFILRPESSDPEKAMIGSLAVRCLPNLTAFRLSDTPSLKSALKELNVSKVYSHSFVDFTRDAPAFVKALVQDMGIEWDVKLHDYEVICPRINLVDENGLYCGEPDVKACNKCLSVRGSDFNVTDITKWRESRRSWLMSTSRVIVPDEDVAERISRYYPEISFDVAPHDDVGQKPVATKRPRVNKDEKVKVVVIGAISKLKGFDVLLGCARESVARELPIEFVLMGYSMNDRLLESSGVVVTGKYKEKEAIEKLSQLEPHLVWLPSISPETYSYTLSMAISSGYPIFSFDIGAIGSRLRALGIEQGLMPLSMAKRVKDINDVFLKHRESVLMENDRVEMENDGFYVAEQDIAGAFISAK